MAEDNKKDGKQGKTSWRDKISARFNSASVKSLKRKALIGSAALAIGTVGIGGAVGGKYMYDETERTVQIYVESLDSKRTVVERHCETRTTTSESRYGSEETTVNKSDCDEEVLNRIIRTPQGVFANNASRIDLKTKNDTETIDANLKPGAWYEVVVKGWDMFGPPNIMSVERLPNNWREIREQRAQGVEVNPDFSATGQEEDMAQSSGATVTPAPAATGATLEELQRQLEILQLQEQLKALQNGGAQNGANNNDEAVKPPLRNPTPKQ